MPFCFMIYDSDRLAFMVVRLMVAGDGEVVVKFLFGHLTAFFIIIAATNTIYFRIQIYND